MLLEQTITVGHQFVIVADTNSTNPARQLLARTIGLSHRPANRDNCFHTVLAACLALAELDARLLCAGV
jgi:hypothetical protein